MMMMMSGLNLTNTSSRIDIILAHSPRADMSLHSDTFCCDSEPSSLFALSTYCFVLIREHQTNLIVLGLTRLGLPTHDLPHSREAR